MYRLFIFFSALGSALCAQCVPAVAFNLVTPLRRRNELHSLFKREKLWCRNPDTSDLI